MKEDHRRDLRERIANAILFVTAQAGRRVPTRDEVFDALEDVFGNELPPEEMSRLTDIVLHQLHERSAK